MKYALIEIDSNSIKFYMQKLDKKEIITLFDENTITKLGRGIQKDGFLQKESINVSLEVIKNYFDKAIRNKADKIEIIGTMALRIAKNTADFKEKIKEITNLDLQIISGDKEAELSSIAVLSSINNLEENLIIFDTGGGSTEFIFINNKKIIEKISINIGSVVLTDKFFKSNEIEIKDINILREYLNRVFKNNNLEYKLDKLLKFSNKFSLVGIGGTVTTISAIKNNMKRYNPKVIHGSKIKKDDLLKQIDILLLKTLEEKKRIVGLQPKRADIILAGVIIVESIMNYFNIDNLTVSDKGIRAGMVETFFR